MKWVYSITQPHSDVNRTHTHPHHTPLVDGLQHLCARTPVDIKGEKDFFGNPDWDPDTSMTLASRFCHMSSVRSTSDGRGPVTRKRVQDREEPGKPRKDDRRGRCHPLEAGFWPLWMTPLQRTNITEY
jgi:hypothetical protein